MLMSASWSNISSYPNNIVCYHSAGVGYITGQRFEGSESILIMDYRFVIAKMKTIRKRRMREDEFQRWCASRPTAIKIWDELKSLGKKL